MRVHKVCGECAKCAGEKKRTTESTMMRFVWRRDPESNWARRICNPLHNRFAIAPKNSIQQVTALFDHQNLLFFENGAGNEARTRDLNLGKVALYQLSYSRIQPHIVHRKTMKAERTQTENQNATTHCRMPTGRQPSQSPQPRGRIPPAQFAQQPGIKTYQKAGSWG
jgi:hypothetical protein